MFVYPEYPVEVLFVHSQEVAVVLSEYDGSSAGGIVHQGQFAKIISFMQRTHHTLNTHIQSEISNSVCH